MENLKGSLPSSRRSLPRFRVSSLKLSAGVLKNVELTTRFKPKEIRKLHQQFLAISDRKGLLGPDGFRQSMGILGMVQDSILCQRLFSVFNESQTGQITFEEFAKGLGVLVKGTVDEKLTFAFAMTDIDGSGEITPEELEITVDSIMRIYSGIMGSVSTATLDRSKIRKMFNKLDRNKDGMITLEEYKRGMKLHPEFVGSLRGSDLFTVGQNNLIKEEQSKNRRYKRVANSILNDVNRATELFEEIMEEKKNEEKRNLPRSSSEETMTSQGEEEEEEDGDTTGELVASLEEQMMCTLHTISAKAQTIMDEGFALRTSSSVQGEQPQQKLVPRNSAESSTTSTYDEKKEKPDKINLEFSVDQDYIMDSLLNSPTHIVNGLGFGGLGENGETNDDGAALGRYLTPASKGSTVFFGHKNWDLVINVMKGIQMAVGRSAAEAARPLNVFDFSVKEKYTLVAGAKMGKHAQKGVSSKDIDADRSGRSCRFVDYAPVVFCKLREHFGIRNESYVHSIGPGNMLSNLMLGSLSSLAELGSEGKSGSFFYFTSDGRFMVKTVHKEEHKLLRNILPQYYYRMTRVDGPDSLLCRVVGCHVVRLSKNSKIGAEKIYFVVMTNMLNTDLDLYRRFDLKGSWVGRKQNEAARENPKTTLKDVDFTDLKQKIRIGRERKEKLMAALRRDAAFLEEKHIIDYSLLLGIHKHDNRGSIDSFISSTDSEKRLRSDLGSQASISSASSLGSDDPQDIYIPFFQQDNGGMTSEDGSETYVMGVIDFLTLYNGKKVAERIGKSMLLYDRQGISVQPPQKYAKRFIDFMNKIIE
eukprot:CAMPEP_0203757878 /NCGR_PEP_ID=MMETSP0098-20131031/10738_1 /ASSEMBLY_ACC=CAM_ASM_000208 /TAXON_ID=96639 /ORGANISM=" , Strain NY0313808BC1" /LENGTH=813 /DNA_ID=CAMNT_0050650123 /DNA_START=36 /DNA_END=2477 /DNA_ORIENTATION=-